MFGWLNLEKQVEMQMSMLLLARWLRRHMEEIVARGISCIHPICDVFLSTISKLRLGIFDRTACWEKVVLGLCSRDGLMSIASVQLNPVPELLSPLND